MLRMEQRLQETDMEPLIAPPGPQSKTEWQLLTGGRLTGGGTHFLQAHGFPSVITEGDSQA